MAGDGDLPGSGGATAADRPAASMSAREEVGHRSQVKGDHRASGEPAEAPPPSAHDRDPLTPHPLTAPPPLAPLSSSCSTMFLRPV